MADEINDSPQDLHSKKPQIPFTQKDYKAVQQHVDAIGAKFATFVRMAALEKAGHGAVETSPIKSVELIGTIHASNPEECREDVKREIYCSEHPNGDSYNYLEVIGDCMDKQVPEGATALFQNSGWAYGQTIAAFIEWPNGCELCLRVIEYDPRYKCHRLNPDSHNPTHKPILLSPTPPRPEDKDKYHWLSPQNAQIRGVFHGDYIMKAKKKK